VDKHNTDANQKIERWILGDSMIRHLNDIYGSVNISLRGKGIVDLSRYVLDNSQKLAKAAAVALLIGTNDIANNMDLENFERYYVDTINQVKRAAPQSVVFLCTILPRPVDAVSGEWFAYNKIISQLAGQPRCAFVPTCRSFSGPSGQPDWRYFAKDGLHLNDKGVSRLQEVLRSKLNDKMIHMYYQRFFGYTLV
jgi:lysophospholipase L1-like esterase